VHVTADWPFTARENELNRAIEALRRSGGVILAGSSGVGKSRLAREVLRDAGRRGRSGRWIGATRSARTVALGPFAPVISSPDRTTGAGQLAQAAAALRDETAVLVVDDAHLLDDASAALLHSLAVEHATGLVITLRADEPAPDAITSIWKDDLLERLDVPALDETATTRLLQSALGGPLDVPTAQRLYSSALGNVLWLRYLVHGERAAGRLTRQVGQWRWCGEPQLTPALVDLVEAHFGPLSATQRYAMELLAFGGSLPSTVLDELAEPDAVAELAERELLTVRMTGRTAELELAHPLYNVAVRSRASTLRARQVCGALAESLRTCQPGEQTLRRAVLTLDGACPNDHQLLTDAAPLATERADGPLAERLLRAACDGGGGFAARLALGLSLAWSTPGGEADVQLLRAERIAENDEQRVRAACARAVVHFFHNAQPDDALGLLDRAERSTGVGPARAEQPRAVRATFASVGNRLDEAAELGRPVVAAPDAPAFARAWAGCAVLLHDGLVGRPGQVDELAEQLIETAVCLPETAMLRFDIRYLQSFGLGLNGYLDRADARGASLRELPGTWAATLSDCASGRVALNRGQVYSAAHLLRGNRADNRGVGAGWTAVSETSVGLALGMAGDPVGAREAIGRADQFHHSGITYHEPELALARAWLCAAEGVIGQAIRQGESAARLAASNGQWAVEVFARHSCVSFGDTSQADRLAVLADLLSTPRALAAAAHAAALAADEPEQLLAASELCENYGLLLSAADAAAQAASRYRARDAGARTAFATARAAGLAEQCEGARTPALLDGLTPLSISNREREVATLASNGLSNRQIAQRLHVSVRTVEGHVYRACTRLGLPDRSALATLISNRAQPARNYLA
jgi:DNA-binding NarL/FixJ family response regulator